MEVHRHEQEHERLLSDLEKLEKQTEVAVQARKPKTAPTEDARVYVLCVFLTLIRYFYIPIDIFYVSPSFRADCSF